MTSSCSCALFIAFKNQFETKKINWIFPISRLKRMKTVRSGIYDKFVKLFPVPSRLLNSQYD